MKAKARAYANIALIKYWGKKNKALVIPYQSSLSFSVDQFYTETEVCYDESLVEDVVTLDGKTLEGIELERVATFMDEVRTRYQIPYYAKIDSVNHVPKKAGLASSASAFAALALAATKAYQIGLDSDELSTIARLGSGSASRSMYGGFSYWNKGVNHETSAAYPLDIEWNEFRMIACIVDKKEKKISSREAMEKSVEDKTFYKAWIKQSKTDFKRMKKLIFEKDIDVVGALAEQNALAMHASLLASGIWYFEPKTVELMNRVQHLRETLNVPIYFTMDAGPNLKLITLETNVDQVLEEFKDVETIVLKKGENAHVITTD